MASLQIETTHILIWIVVMFCVSMDVSRTQRYELVHGKEELRYKPFFAILIFLPVIIMTVFGHTPTWKFHKTMHIFHGKRMLAIDCGSGFPNHGGQLSCIRLEDMTEYYSDDGTFTKEEAAELRKA